MVILERGASRSNIERYFITFFDAVNNESRGMNIFPEANMCSKATLNIAFRGRNRVSRLYLKIMYRAVYLDEIFKKSSSLLIIDDIYIIVLACSEELKEVLLAFVPKPVPNLYPPSNLLQSVIQCPFLPHRNHVSD